MTRATGRRLNKCPERVIDWFDDFNGPNDYGFLSNFYEGLPIVIDGRGYMTGEHAFQAYKATNVATFNSIAYASSPGQAKSRGRNCVLRPDWEAVKFDVMVAVVRSKFEDGSPTGDALQATCDALLIEGTFWGDTIWGVDLHKPGYEGQNWLGRILMARRAELRSGSPDLYVPQVPRLWWER